MTLHVFYQHQCSSCGAFYIPYDLDIECPNCGVLEKQRFDFIAPAADSALHNFFEYGTYTPKAWYVGSLGDHVLEIIFEILETQRNSEEPIDEVAKRLVNEMKWGDQLYLKDYTSELAQRVYQKIGAITSVSMKPNKLLAPPELEQDIAIFSEINNRAGSNGALTPSDRADLVQLAPAIVRKHIEFFASFYVACLSKVSPGFSEPVVDGSDEYSFHNGDDAANAIKIAIRQVLDAPLTLSICGLLLMLFLKESNKNAGFTTEEAEASIRTIARLSYAHRVSLIREFIDEGLVLQKRDAAGVLSRRPPPKPEIAPKGAADSMKSTTSGTPGGIIRVQKELPDGVRGWSWGAFLLNWVWAIGNKTWIGLLVLIPYIGFIVAIVLGIKGREWAWKNKEWASFEEFDRVQRKWSTWGVGIAVCAFSISLLISFSAYKDYVRRSKEIQLQLGHKQEAVGKTETHSTAPALTPSAVEPIAKQLPVISTGSISGTGRGTPDDAKLANVLLDALRLKPGTAERVLPSSKPIVAYANAGYLDIKPLMRIDYSDYRIFKKPAYLLGHGLVAIDEEYFKEWVGCCVATGLAVTVKVNGSLTGLKNFAGVNGCSLIRDTDARYYPPDVPLPSAPKGTYATLSCKQRDSQAR